ncbi:MAG: hypothetical protein RRY29_09340 [Desulfovibrionaceae bacterium]
MDTVQDLQTVICQQYGTTHKFCRSTGLPRATVYQVLAGSYAGNIERQKYRIWAILHTPEQNKSLGLTAIHISDTLTRVACSLCAWKGRCTRRRARRCTVTREKQVNAIMGLLTGGNYEYRTNT